MKYPVILCLLFIPFFAQSQSNYKKGSVVTNSGQVISGYINYKQWDQNPEDISFKKGLNDLKPQVFTPSNISSFSVDGFDDYYSYKGKVSMNRTQYPDLPTGRDTTSKNIEAFLKQIISGDHITLFVYTDRIKERYFIQEKQAQPFELMYQQYYDDTKSNTLTSNEYIGQLNTLIGKYDPAYARLLDKAARTHYNGSELEEIVNSINGKRRDVKKHGSTTRYFVGAAVNIAQTSFDGNIQFAKLSKANTYTPQLSAGIDIFTNPSVQRVIFRVEASFTYINPKVSGVYTDPNNDVDPLNYTFNQYSGTISPQFIWNVYSTDAFKFFVGTGFTFSFSTYTNETFVVNEKYQGPDTYHFNLEKTSSSFPVNAGVVLNKRIELFASASLKSFSLYDGGEPYSLNSDSYTAGIRFLFARSGR